MTVYLQIQLYSLLLTSRTQVTHASRALFTSGYFLRSASPLKAYFPPSDWWDANVVAVAFATVARSRWVSFPRSDSFSATTVSLVVCASGNSVMMSCRNKIVRYLLAE